MYRLERESERERDTYIHRSAEVELEFSFLEILLNYFSDQ